jgi:hypothetical protein
LDRCRGLPGDAGRARPRLAPRLRLSDRRSRREPYDLKRIAALLRGEASRLIATASGLAFARFLVDAGSTTTDEEAPGA